MMEPIRYYKDRFGPELLRVAKATRTTVKDRISIISLLPDSSPSGGFGDTAGEFQRLNEKPMFLFCFFSALIDQAIHSALNEEHPFFDRIARYPKFCGILGSYHTNLHPALLLLIATIYATEEGPTVITRDFEALASFFPGDYKRFLIEEYPRLTGRLQTAIAQQRAVGLLFAELSNATAPLSQPASLRPYSDSVPDLSLFRRWLSLAASNINITLNNIEQSGANNR